MKWAILALCAACSMSKSSESQSSYAQKVDTVTERGAVKVTTTVEEFVVQGPLAATGAGRENVAPASRSVAPAAPTTGPLLRRITRVTERDPVVTHTDSAVQASGSAESQSKTRFGFQLWPWLLGAGVLAAGGFALWHLKPPWLGWLFRILGRAN